MSASVIFLPINHFLLHHLKQDFGVYLSKMLLTPWKPDHFILAVLAAEQRQILAADERKREFHEEKRNEFESYAEEEHDGTWSIFIGRRWKRRVRSLKFSSSTFRAKREEQREHRAVEGVPLWRDASCLRVQPSLHLRVIRGDVRLLHSDAFPHKMWPLT